MPSSFPGSPRIIKGALIGTDPVNPLASVIFFQYNPETLTRRLEARSMGGEEGDRSEAFRLTGPPKETISLKVEIDATDQVSVLNPASAISGIYPSLSALEMLLYPKSNTVIKNAALARLGNIEIVPPESPLTLFVWGPGRVVPVRLTGFSVNEQGYDQYLNPIRAEVELSLLVLSYYDLPFDSIGYQLFLTHQIAKEGLAITNVLSSAQNFGQGLKIF
jgi:hypothetical protein